MELEIPGLQVWDEVVGGILWDGDARETEKLPLSTSSVSLNLILLPH